MEGPDGAVAARGEQRPPEPTREESASRLVAVTFVVAMLASVGLVAVYVAGGQTQVEGLLLFVAFGAVGIGLGLWVRRIIGPVELVEERYPMRSHEPDRHAFEDTYRAVLGETVVGGRRRFLLRLLGGVGGMLGVALLLPLRSLGPGPGGDLFQTGWAQGRRVVDTDGRPLRPGDIVADQAVTVFPEGATGSADSQAILVGVRPGRFDAAAVPVETVDALVCYSKICTHAGCPVGLYRARAGELLCPCHQSTFDVYQGARVLSGPAGRPLPQLPLGVDDAGFLVALGDFPQPVGPSFWDMTHDQEESA